MSPDTEDASATEDSTTTSLPTGLQRALVVAQREFTTLLRTRTILLLAAGYLAVVLGLAVATGAAGYLPVTLDLVRPMELLVPVLAFAFGYRSIFADAERGELETIRTYPVSRPVFVGGVYLGRAAGLLPVVLVPLVLVGLAVALTPGEGVTVIAASETIDSPAVLFRFLFLTGVFSLVALAVATAVSAIARSTKEALALVVVLFLALVVGFDATLLAAVSGGVLSPDALAPLLAFSPNSAYRGLVFSVAVGEAYTAGAPTASPLLNVAGLLTWLGLSLVVAVRSVWRT